MVKTKTESSHNHSFDNKTVAVVTYCHKIKIISLAIRKRTEKNIEAKERQYTAKWIARSRTLRSITFKNGR